VIISSIIVTAIVLSSNYFIDPYAVFGSSELELGEKTNERHYKTKHILNVPTYDTWIMGSSRPDIIPPPAVSSLLENNHIYNYSFFAARQTEVLQLLEFYSKHHPEKLPRKLYYGIEYFTFKDDVASEPSYARSFPPEVLNESVLKYYFGAITSNSIIDVFGKYINHSNQPSIRFNRIHGHYQIKKYDDLIATSHDQHAQSIINTPLHTQQTKSWSNKQFEAFGLLIKLIKANDIELTVFTNPMYEPYLETFSLDDRTEWHKRIESTLKEVSYYDFSTHVEITQNPYLWYDVKHYFPSVGKYMFEHMTGSVLSEI